MRLADFSFRQREKFLYRYIYFDDWELELRVEAFLPPKAKQFYPTCIAGNRAAPIEDCGGPKRFFELKDHYSFFHIDSRMYEIINDGNIAENRWDNEDEVRTYLFWLNVGRLERRELNQRLRQRFSKKTADLESEATLSGGLIP